MKKSSAVSQRGYKSVREKVDKYPRAYMSCHNCFFFYQGSGDDEEVCQNPDTLEYDMVVEENRIYCLRWKPNQSAKKEVSSREEEISKARRADRKRDLREKSNW